MNLKKYISGIFIATALCVGVTANAAVTSVKPDRNIGVYTSGQAVSFIMTHGTAGESVTYTIEDINDKVKKTATVTLGSTAGETAGTYETAVNFGTFKPGWYEVKINGFDTFASFTVVKEMKEKPASSPFSTMLYGFSGAGGYPIEGYIEALGLVGVDTVRDGTSWSHNTASSIDKQVTPLNENGIKALLTLELPPENSQYIDNAKIETGNLFYMAEMMKNQSNKYKGRVYAYEIINEPDLNSKYAPIPYSADVFSSYYKVVALGIEDTNKDALKSFGGLAEASTEFGELMMQNGVAKYTDSLNVHLHNTENTQKGTITFQSPRVSALRNWTVLYGNGQPLWNTEAGLSMEIDEYAVVKAKTQQAKYAITSAVQSISEYGTKNHFWFIARYYIEEGSNYGTASSNHFTYPAWYSLSLLVRGLGEGKPIGQLIGASEKASGVKVSGYFFDTGAGNDAVVLWTNDVAGTDVSYQQLKTTEPVTVMNLIGGTEYKYAPNSKNIVNIPVTREPVIVIYNGRANQNDYIRKTFETEYVRDVDRTVGEKVILQALWSKEGSSDPVPVENGRYVVTPGATYNITLNIYNFNEQAVSSSIKLTPDKSVTVVGSAEQSFSAVAHDMNYNATDAQSKDNAMETLNFQIKINDDAQNQYKGHFSFGGTASGTAISETVCGYVVERNLDRTELANLGTVTAFSVQNSKSWVDGNKTTGSRNSFTISSNTATSATFTATIRTGSSRFWFPVLNVSASELAKLATTDGFVFDISGTSLGTGTKIIMYASVSGGSYSAELGDLTSGSKTIVVPWTKMYAYNGDVPKQLDPSKITEISLGFQTRGSSQVKYTVSNPGYYTLSGNQDDLVVKDFVTLSGIEDRGIYKEADRHNKLVIDGEFDDIYLNHKKFTDYIDLGDGAAVELSSLEPGAYSLMVTKNVGFGKIDYKEISFCIKAADDHTPDGVFY